MAWFRCLLFIILCPSIELAAESPMLPIRLAAALSTETMEVGDAVEGVVIAAARHEGEVLVPASWTVRGIVAEIEKARGRIRLRLDFRELVGPAGEIVPLQARVAEVDNAREIVDFRGFIVSPSHPRLRPGGVQTFLAASLAADPITLSAVSGLRLSRLLFSSASIDFPPGVEMDLAILNPEAIRDDVLPPAPSIPDVSEHGRLIRLARSEPYQTFSMRMRRPADLVNVILVGAEEVVRRAFEEAGWVTADEMNFVSSVKLAYAFSRYRPYPRAPMSRLVLEEDLPVFALQKALNTVAKRHHIRIYRRPETFAGFPVWYGAATHDVAIEYSYERRKFIHRIDSDIDVEREKIVNDLLFTGRVEGRALIERPDAPRETPTASGVLMRTDGRVAVVVLGHLPGEKQ